MQRSNYYQKNINRNNNSLKNRLLFIFTFTGKEKDEETGFSYFGARYYDSDLSGLFLSVDPMADKYPSISPYAYCAWNPLKLVDPDGKDIWEITHIGQLKKICESDNDEFYLVDNKGNRIEDKSLVYSGRIVTGEKTLKDNKGLNVNYLEFDNELRAKEVFEFASDNCIDNSAEFGWEKIKENNDCSLDLIGFGTNNESRTSANQTLFENDYQILKMTHNHPDGLMDASSSDVKFAEKVQSKFPMATFSIYRVDGTYLPYDKNTPVKENRLNTIIIK